MSVSSARISIPPSISKNTIASRETPSSARRRSIFEGTVIARKNGGIAESFTVRRVSFGVGTEKTFPLHSPNVQKVEVVRKGRVRRAKLYYLRDRLGKSAKIKEKI